MARSRQKLNRLLQPGSIAVIGGGTWCVNLIEQCQKIGFTGKIWPVHPTKTTIGGLPAYPSVDALPKPPDASFIGVNRTATVETVSALSAQGAGGAICFASGFREAKAELGDGDDLETALLEAAGDMPIIGPNCYGLINYLDGAALWPDQHGGERVERGVALITQSSNIAINLTMQTRGLPIAYVVTAGNQAQMGLAEIGEALLDDPRVTALGLHIEGMGDIRAMEALAARARDLGKPIVAIKIGRSDQARAATISHTASLAGSDAGGRAFLSRLGFAQVDSLPEFLETLKLLHVVGPLSSNRIASASCSGGEASLIADTAEGRNVRFPALNDDQVTALRTALGPKVALANPLDYHTYIWGDKAAMTATFTAMMQAELAMGIVVLDFPRADRCSADEWGKVIDAVAKTQLETGRPMAILASLPETMPESIAKQLVQSGIMAFSGMTEAMKAIGRAAELGQPRPLPAPVFLTPPPQSGSTLTEADAKAVIERFGITLPKAAQASSPDEAARAAQSIGFPVVLKGEGLAHKSEAGAVILNLQSETEVRSAAHNMPADSFLVEEMIIDGVAELLVGVTYDPAHGHLLTLAAGGTLTEILQDSQTLLVPSTRDEILSALRHLRIAPLLDGFRGAKPANMNAILDAVMALQTCVQANPVTEIEINPLILTPDRAVAADALIRTGGEQ